MIGGREGKGADLSSVDACDAILYSRSVEDGMHGLVVTVLSKQAWQSWELLQHQG